MLHPAVADLSMWSHCQDRLLGAGNCFLHCLVFAWVAHSFPPACLQLCQATHSRPIGILYKLLRNSMIVALSSVSLAACCPLQVFGPFTFYDVPGKESIPENASSYVNLVEVEMVLNVYTLLVLRCASSWRVLYEKHGRAGLTSWDLPW